MRSRSTFFTVACVAAWTLLGGAFAQAQQTASAKASNRWEPAAVTRGSQESKSAPNNKQPQQKPTTPTSSEKTTIKTTERPAVKVETDEYKEVSDFFNIREANPSVTQGEWEFEVPLGWSTSDGKRDDITIGTSLKYGLTEDMFAEMEVLPVMLGKGDDHGAGETALILFNRFVREDGTMPAFAMWAEMRIPTGDGSSGVDGALNFNLTKTIVPKFRGHLGGFIKTANGAPGGEDEDDRRNFQWGIGPGFDYQCSDNFIGLINYLHRSSEEEGLRNQHILELGGAYAIAENQHLKAAVDIGLNGDEQTPNWGAKLQWSIEWK